MKKNLRKNSILNFNNIDKNLTENQINEIENLYKFYHKKCWMYKYAFKYLKNLDLSLKISSSSLIIIGSIIGSIMLNPIVISTISGVGILIEIIQEQKNYKKRADLARYGFINYEKLLINLRSNLRGIEYNYKF